MFPLKVIKYEVVSLVEYLSWLIFLLPRGRLFNYVKSVYLRFFFQARIGARVVFYPGVWIFTGRNLSVGNDVDLAKGVLITTDGGVTIGDRTLIGYHTSILSSNHIIPKAPDRIFGSGHQKKAVSIGSDVWIGANCTILPGVTIGEGVVVAAGSVVTRDVPPFHVVAGVPAKIVRERS